MNFKTFLLAFLMFSVGTVTKVFAATHLSVCTQTPNSIVNIRSGPGTNYRIVDQAYNGQDLHYTYKGLHSGEGMPPRDQYGYYWVEVGFDRGNYVGYMRADFLGCSPMNLQDSFTKSS